MANRTRNVQLKINLTEEEKSLFQKKMKMANCKNMNHFLRKVVLESNIYVVDLQPFREIQKLLSRYANSVNQIAKRVNSTGVIYSDDINDMKKHIEHLSKELWQIHSLLLDKNHYKKMIEAIRKKYDKYMGGVKRLRDKRLSSSLSS